MKTLPLNTIQPVCWQCGEDKLVNFFKHFSQHYRKTKYHPTCKKCMIKEYKKYYSRYNDHKYCIFLMCRKFNYPFKTNLVDGALSQFESPTKSKSKTEVPWGTYLGKIPAYANNKKLTLNEFEDAETEYNTETPISNFEVTDDIKYKWGNNFDVVDYEFLNKRYLEYCRNVDTTIRAMESLVEDICHTELLIRRKREERTTDTKIMKDMNDILQKLLTAAGLDSKSKREMDSSEALETYGLRIKEIEENQPCEIFEQRDLFKDFDGILHLVKKYILRPLKNLVLGTKDFNISQDDLSDEYIEDNDG